LLGIDFQALEAAWKQLGGSFDGSSSKFQLWRVTLSSLILSSQPGHSTISTEVYVLPNHKAF
jgi:hypothetical protein